MTLTGNTPLVRINSLSDALGVEILVRGITFGYLLQPKPQADLPSSVRLSSRAKQRYAFFFGHHDRPLTTYTSAPFAPSISIPEALQKIESHCRVGARRVGSDSVSRTLSCDL